MSLESDVFNALKGLVNNRCYPDKAPVGAVQPYIVFAQVGGPSPTYVERTVPNIKGARIQINVWSATRLEANTLALQIEATLTASTAFDAKPLGAFTAVTEDETDLRGTRQDFSIWSAR